MFTRIRLLDKGVNFLLVVLSVGKEKKTTTTGFFSAQRVLSVRKSEILVYVAAVDQ